MPLLPAAAAAAEEITVALLGAGSPVPSPTRFSQSTLVEAGELALVFDMGRGVPSGWRKSASRSGRWTRIS